MNNTNVEAVILIPSLEPDDRLPKYIDRLKTQGFNQIVIVDDGSSEKYQSIFQEIERKGCTVLHHDVNKGKGAALKTGYRWIKEHCKDFEGVITADADGQHTPEDCRKLASCLGNKKKAIYLGTRDFSLAHVPPKSRYGNRITSFVFWLLYGKWIADTQTGLRAFRKEELLFMLDVEGDRFEYEMNVLIACARAHIPMIPETIETVYENDNSGTHFHPIRDSIRIYKVIFGNFFRFMGMSFVSFLLDQGIAWLLAAVVLVKTQLDMISIIWISGILARVCSAVFNFVVNKSFVFQFHRDTKKAAIRYLMVCLAIICLSNAGVSLLHSIGVNDRIAKVICDSLLYFVSYNVQGKWVFNDIEV